MEAYFLPVCPTCKPESVSDKFQKLIEKREKRKNRIEKNLLCEFKSQDISGHKFEDLDSVLQSLGEAEEEKKGKVKKKKKAEKRKVASKEGRQSVEKEVKSGKEYPEERMEAKESEVEELGLSEIGGITSNICSRGSNGVEVESEADIDLEDNAI